MNVRNESREIDHASPSWDEDMAEYHFDFNIAPDNLFVSHRSNSNTNFIFVCKFPGNIYQWRYNIPKVLRIIQ
mgnify:CR=1 FL=1